MNRRSEKEPQPVDLMFRGFRDLPIPILQSLGVSFTESTAYRAHGLVVVEERWIFTPMGIDWVAGFRLVSQDGRPTIGEFRLFPAEKVEPRLEPGQWSIEALGVHAKVPEGGITSRLLRRVQFPIVTSGSAGFLGVALAKPAIRTFRGLARQGAPAGFYKREDKEESNLPFKVKKPAATIARRGKTPRPDLFYAQLAAEYSALLKNFNRRPVSAIAKRLKLEQAKVRDMISAARKRGFLTPGQQGRPGGELTPAALTLLEQATTRSKG